MRVLWILRSKGHNRWIVRTYIAETHILDELRINFRFCDEGFEGLVDEEIKGSVFEATSARFC